MGRGARSLIAKPNFHSRTIFDDDMVITEIDRAKITFNKPICIGYCTLDICGSVWVIPHFRFTRGTSMDTENNKLNKPSLPGPSLDQEEKATEPGAGKPRVSSKAQGGKRPAPEHDTSSPQSRRPDKRSKLASGTYAQAATKMVRWALVLESYPEHKLTPEDIGSLKGLLRVMQALKACNFRPHCGGQRATYNPLDKPRKEEEATQKGTKKVGWWNNTLANLRDRVRKAWNIVKNTCNEKGRRKATEERKRLQGNLPQGAGQGQERQLEALLQQS
ncbi:hypothetical protein PV326_007829 [Microctonus aethiopoides]|nr:hypothetical protein PV326_007829 [Microctonus aethiopoides]